VNEAEAVSALRRMGLKGRERLPTKVLSQGQRRRVALARLLVGRARLWVLDEPVDGIGCRRCGADWRFDRRTSGKAGHGDFYDPSTAGCCRHGNAQLVAVSVMKKLFMLFILVVRRDLVLAMRRRADVLTTLIFFVMVVSLFPLGVGPETDMLRKMAPGVLWVAALLSSMLSLGRLFSADYLDGTLEQMLLAAAVPVGAGTGQDGFALDGIGPAAGVDDAGARVAV